MILVPQYQRPLAPQYQTQFARFVQGLLIKSDLWYRDNLFWYQSSTKKNVCFIQGIILKTDFGTAVPTPFGTPVPNSVCTFCTRIINKN